MWTCLSKILEWILDKVIISIVRPYVSIEDIKHEATLSFYAKEFMWSVSNLLVFKYED